MTSSPSGSFGGRRLAFQRKSFSTTSAGNGSFFSSSSSSASSFSASAAAAAAGVDYFPVSLVLAEVGFSVSLDFLTASDSLDFLISSSGCSAASSSVLSASQLFSSSSVGAGFINFSAISDIDLSKRSYYPILEVYSLICGISSFGTLIYGPLSSFPLPLAGAAAFFAFGSDAAFFLSSSAAFNSSSFNSSANFFKASFSSFAYACSVSFVYT